MYIIFDEVPDAVISKERESCFNAGSDGEPLAQYITDARTKHASNVNALRQTIELFNGDAPKRRLHGKVTARLEQERKWVKHYDVCTNEHKKGTIIAKLKTQLETTRKEAIKKERDLRAAHDAALDDLRKQVRTQTIKEVEDERKARKKKKSAKKWWHWIAKLWSDKSANDNTVTPAKMVAKELVVPGGMSAKQKREFYMARRVAANNN